MEFDLSDAYNRIVDTWYPVFASTSPLSMPSRRVRVPDQHG